MPETDYTDPAPCLLLCQDPAAEVNWRAAAESLRIDRLVVRPIPADADTLPLPTTSAVLVVDLAKAAQGSGDILLHRLDRWCRDTGCSAIVSFSAEEIDRVAAAIENDTVVLLCEPDQTDRIVALATALPLRANRVAEIDTIANVLRLQQLADEVGRIARALARNSGDPRPTESAVSDASLSYRPPPSPEADMTSGDIRAILRLRRQREALFGAELFADPAWDMILDLAAARIEGVDVAISSLCIAAAVPPTTALRWIRTLTELHIFERRSDVRDGRRIFVALTDDAAARVIAFLGRAKAIGVLPV